MMVGLSQLLSGYWNINIIKRSGNMLLNINNNDILKSERGFEYEGICGSDNGIMFDESLMLFFRDNDIHIVNYKPQKSVTLKYDNAIVQFPLFLGKEGSSYISEHIDFRYGQVVGRGNRE